MIRRSSLVFGLLLAGWLAIVGWQAVEHNHIRETARTALVNRGRDITSILGVVIRSQRRFGVVSKDRLESAIKDLIKAGEVSSIVLLNAEGEEVASAGAPVDVHGSNIRTGVHWEGDHLTLANVVDLGTNFSSTIILPRTEFDTNRVPSGFIPGGSNRLSSAISDTNGLSGTNSGRSRFSTSRPPFGRPPWISEADWAALKQRQGLHSFVIVMSNQEVRAATERDLWLRSIIALFALGAFAGTGLAWGNLVKSSELQIRLVRASEQNTHLKELNLAAAGLAHETRNPLNIIRGLAQMISKDAAITPEIRERSRDIAEEADRVTAQLSEFINYSRPREVRRKAVDLGGVVRDVGRALAHDIEEKKLKLQVFEEPVTIQADEQLLRQTVFNLMINSVQALPDGGEISVSTVRNNGDVALEVRDNGPGVPPDQRKEIFKPYFTTHQKGSGLGLAVVQQIVSAHEWEIECRDNEPKGALFRISRMKPAAKPG